MSETTPGARWRHDLKNQLGIVLGFAELILEDQEPSSATRADLEEILKAARRAMDLVDAWEAPSD